MTQSQSNSSLAAGFGFAYLRTMQREQKSPKSMAKSFVAGLLAVLLLAFGVLGASGSLHHSLHHDGDTDASSCVICLLAQGHIDLPEASPLLATATFYSLCGLLAASAGVPWSFDFLLPPGRAPPCPSRSF